AGRGERDDVADVRARVAHRRARRRVVDAYARDRAGRRRVPGVVGRDRAQVVEPVVERSRVPERRGRVPVVPAGRRVFVRDRGDAGAGVAGVRGQGDGRADVRARARQRHDRTRVVDAPLRDRTGLGVAGDIGDEDPEVVQAVAEAGRVEARRVR